MLIKGRRPPFNRSQNPDHPKLRAAYLTLFDPDAAARTPHPAHDCSAAIRSAGLSHADLYMDDDPCLGEECIGLSRVITRDGCPAGCPICHGLHHAYSSGMNYGSQSQQESLPSALWWIEKYGNLATWEASHELRSAFYHLVDTLDPDLETAFVAGFRGYITGALDVSEHLANDLMALGKDQEPSSHSGAPSGEPPF